MSRTSLRLPRPAALQLAALVAVAPAAGGLPAVCAATELDLAPVVITAFKGAEPQARVTQQIDVLTREDIAARPLANENLSEVLRYEPGLFINPLSRNDANWGAFGGLGPKYNVYLVDGLPVDSFADSMALDSWMLERTEVFKGPASIMYTNYLSADFAGNTTPLAGITNFILAERIEAPMTRVQVGGGSWGTWLAKVYNQGAVGGLNWFGGITYQQSNYTDYGTPNSWLNMIDDPEYAKTKAYLKATWFFDDDRQRISVFGNYANHDGDAGRPNRDFDHNYGLANLAWSAQFTPAVLVQARVGWRDYDRGWSEDNFPPALTEREHDGVLQRIIPADLSMTVRHLGDSLFTIGADYQQANYRTYAKAGPVRRIGNNADATLWGLYAQENLVTGRWVLRGGLRYSEQRNDFDLISGTAPAVSGGTWSNLLWSAGLRFNATDQFALFANGGSSFVAPSAKSVGGTLLPTDRDVAGRNGQLPNPNLQPEYGQAFDLGLEWQVNAVTQARLRAFLNQVNDAIVENVVSNNPSQSQSVNAGDSEAWGAEAELSQVLSERWQWFVNGTYVQTDVRNDLDSDQNGAQIPFSPQWMANLGVTFKPVPRFSVIPYVQYVGNYYDSTSRSTRSEFGNYGLLNARLVGDVTDRVTLALDLWNLTDNHFEMPWQFQDTGFSFMATLEVRI